MALGMEVGLGPGDIVLDGDPAPKPHSPHPNFRPMSVVAECLDGYGGRPRPRQHCVRWGPSSLPLFSPCIVAKMLLDQDAT